MNLTQSVKRLGTPKKAYLKLTRSVKRPALQKGLPETGAIGETTRHSKKAYLKWTRAVKRPALQKGLPETDAIGAADFILRTQT